MFLRRVASKLFHRSGSWLSVLWCRRRRDALVLVSPDLLGLWLGGSDCDRCGIEITAKPSKDRRWGIVVCFIGGWVFVDVRPQRGVVLLCILFVSWCGVVRL